ncbi:MAG: glycosyltransferase [Gemmatimonadaceae bacterium]|jgi:glycosyltransferase involved in cell wall biosynthesis|nr:glycosyltransferase [Gemmatimonadaceae bacterium]
MSTVDGTVSVVLIVRDGARYLAEALESIVGGGVRPHEVLVIDGGSSDDSASIARMTPGVTVHAQRSTGIAHAYNEGVAMATGEFVAFCSHDDRWRSGKLAAQVAHLRATPAADGTVTAVQHVLHGDVPPAGFRVELLERAVPGFIMETLLMRRAAMARVGRFDPALATSNDTDWFARARDLGVRIDLLDTPFVDKRVHGSNTSLGDASLNAQLLLTLRRSIARKRAAGH